jgi:hypothetical protein
MITELWDPNANYLQTLRIRILNTATQEDIPEFRMHGVYLAGSGSDTALLRICILHVILCTEKNEYGEAAPSSISIWKDKCNSFPAKTIL